MVRKYLVGQYCKNEDFGLNKFVDDFDYSILNHLMENSLVYNNEVDFWYGKYLHYFYFVLVRIVVRIEILLNLNSFVVYFDFGKITSFESIDIVVIMFCKLFSM